MKKSLVTFAVSLFLTLPCLAHEMRPAFLQISQLGTDTFSILLKVPALGPEKRLDLNAKFPKDCKFITPKLSTYTGLAYIDRFTIQRKGGLSGTTIEIEGLSSTRTDVLVRLERKNNATQITRLTPTAPSFIVEATPTATQVAKTYTVLGIEHIWKGIDHLLFVGCLIFITGISRKLLLTITSFTLAHSITLILAALDIVRLPIPPVEACIALSVVFFSQRNRSWKK